MGSIILQVERVVGDLEEARAVSVEDDMNLGALNLGMIAAYYYLQYTTIELFANSVTSKTKLRSAPSSEDDHCVNKHVCIVYSERRRG